MAEKFVLTAQLQLQAPRNIRSVVRDMRRELGSIRIPVVLDVEGRKELDKLTKDLKRAGTTAKKAAGGVSTFGKAVKQVSRDIARIGSLLLIREFSEAAKNAAEFERELVKVSQVTGTSLKNLSGLRGEITRLSTSLGVSSKSLVEVSRVLAQTGISAKEVRVSLDALAKSSLAPTFSDIKNTTETAIAAMKQFKLEAKDLSTVLGQINAVAGQFAVEAGDIGVAIRRAGGVFQKAGGQLTELEALFTSVRSTTRESAETIATGFRTIFTRLQRPRTIKFLRQMGIELTDLKGKFIGPFEAVKRLSIALKDLDPRDIRFAQITEQLGGFRQVSKVIPLIKEFETAQRALNVARAGGASLDRDAATAQQAVLVRVTKVKEGFNALIRTIADNSAIKTFIDGSLRLAEALLKITAALEPLLPLLTALGTLAIAKGVGRLAGGVGGGIGRHKGGRINKFAQGGFVPGVGNADTVPAMLTPGEFVIRKSSAQSIGADRLHGLNKRASGGQIRRYARGTGRRGVTSLRTPAQINRDFKAKVGMGKKEFNDRFGGPRGSELTPEVALATPAFREKVVAKGKKGPGATKKKETTKQRLARMRKERGVATKGLSLRVRDEQYGGLFLSPISESDKPISKKQIQLEGEQQAYISDLLLGVKGPGDASVKQALAKNRDATETLIRTKVRSAKFAPVQFDASFFKKGLRKRITGGDNTQSPLAKKLQTAIADLITGGQGKKVLSGLGLDVTKGGVKKQLAAQFSSGNFPLESVEGAVFESYVGAITGQALSEQQDKFDFPNLNAGTFKKAFVGISPRLKHGETKRTFGQEQFGTGKGKIGRKFLNALRGEAGSANVSLKELGYSKTSLKDSLETAGLINPAAPATGSGGSPTTAAHFGGIIKRRRFAGGGSSGTDTVPALLTPGEFVVKRSSAEKVGYGRLNRMNRTGEFSAGGMAKRYARGGAVQRFAEGGRTDLASGGGGFEKLFILTTVAG